MRELVFFGAGASMEAQVPTANQMTMEIAKQFGSGLGNSLEARAVYFVIGGLLLNRGIHGENPLTEGVNVEEFFNAVQFLANRNTSEISPFVGSWHSTVEELDRESPESQAARLKISLFQGVAKALKGAVPKETISLSTSLDRVLDGAIRAAKKTEMSRGVQGVGAAVEAVVCDLLKKWTQQIDHTLSSGYQQGIRSHSGVGDGRVFQRVATQMIRMLSKLVFVQDVERVSHLAPLRILLTKQPKLTVASLNYDNCVELFCKQHGIPCGTGIDCWPDCDTFDMDGEGILLLKLHGSIDWRTEIKEGDGNRPMSHNVISTVSPDDIEKGEHWPAVIFGRGNKLTADGPFLDILRAFQRELRSTDLLTVVGYSFRDEHINVYLAQWLNGNSSRKMRIVDPGFKTNTAEFAEKLRLIPSSRIEIFSIDAGKAFLQLWPA